MTARRIIRTYLSITAATTLAQSLIWGVNTLFLLWAGLDIFQVMIVNGAFTLGQMVFEVPTGVVADTLGRRVSYLLSVGTVLVATLLYVWVGVARGGVLLFAFASALLGLGFTFYTGAVDAWMVDALHHVGYDQKLDPIFGKAGMVFGITMLIGTTGGGLLGQAALWMPYVARAIILVPCLLIGVFFMPEMGFTPRVPKLSEIGAETSRIARDGITYGVRNPVVRALMSSSLVLGLFGMFGFYSWQKYFLDLLGHNLVWVAGVIAALVGLAQVAAGALVGPMTRLVKRRSTCMVSLTVVQLGAVVAAGLVGLVPALRGPGFWIAVPLYLVSAIAFGIAMPVRAAWLNACIPSEQRATIISLDSLFADAGGTAGQLGLGYLSKAVSIPMAWVLGGALEAGAIPFFVAARRRDPDADEGGECAGTVHEPRDGVLT